MKITRLALGVALVNVAVLSTAHAQVVRQPATPTAYEFEYYAPGDNAPSPSDKAPVPPAPGAPAAAAPAAAPAAGGCDTCNTCNSCCNNSCGRSCGSELCCPEAPDAWKLFDCCCLKEKGIDMGGWVSAGFTVNGNNPASNWNGPLTFNDREDFQMNQLYWYMKKDIDYAKNCGWALGYRIDLMYGTDARFTEAFGLEMDENGLDKWSSNRFYHLAMPQLYADLVYDDLSIKVGHFYTTIGYEVITNPDNFFYSHAYTMQYGEPFTHTGVLFTKPMNDNVKVHAGFHRGWDRWDDNNGKLAFLGGLAYTEKNECTKQESTIAFTITTGDEVAPVTGLDANRTMYSLVYTRKMNSRLTYILQHDYGWQAQGANNGAATAQWYGLNQYLLYQLSCDWWGGVRFEWFRDDDGTRVAALGDSQTRANTNPAGVGGFEGNFYELSVGLNYKPVCNPNLVVRPEVRWDWYEGAGLPFDDGAKDKQFTFAVDAIIKY